MSVEKVLEERGKRYGSFETHAALSQELKTAMLKNSGWYVLKPDQREALEMIQHKIARILNGDANYDDNWVDIAGYSTLVAERLQKVE